MVLESYLPTLPYELIGQVVVALVLLAGGIVTLVVGGIAAFMAWRRGWTGLSNRMYKGYDTDSKEKRPPVWKMRIAGVTAALSHFKFRKIPAVYYEAEELTENETTFRESIAHAIRGDTKQE